MAAIDQAVTSAPAPTPARSSRPGGRPDAPAGPAGRAHRYRPGLDGLRALAVAAVVAYHLSPGGALPGGFFGVDVFFVISGYLITGLLAAERAERGRVRLAAFWGRRVRRLYPAVVAMLAVVIVAGAVADPGSVAASRVTVPAALFYLTNWWFIFHHVPYFQALGRPPLFIHLWSLAIEEQYYLLWPPVLVLLLRRWRRTQVAALAVAGAVLSTLLMAVLYHAGGSTDRIYYGSDTHAQGLLIGSALGLVVAPGRLTARISRPARRLIDAAGGLALAGLAVLMVTCTQTTALTWRGGMLVVAGLSGVAVVAAVHPGSRLSGALGVRPLRWLGTRSYSVYLWHWPIIDLTRPHQDVGFGGLPLLVFRLALIAAAAELSYRYVERPWRSGRAQVVVRRLLADGVRSRRLFVGGAGTALVVVVALLVTARTPPPPVGLRASQTAAASRPITALAGHHPTRTRPTTAPAGSSSTTGPATTAPATTVPATTVPATTVPAVRGAPRGGRVPASLTPSSVPATPPSTVAPPIGPDPALDAAPPGAPVLAIGDSVMLAASADLERAFGPAITVDASVGRQVDAGLARLAAYRRAGRLRGLRAVVVGLGSNGVFSPDQLAELLQLTEGVPRVVLVNVRVPEPWQTPSDQTIDGSASQPRVRVVNWYGASADTALLYPDRIHPDVAGQIVYANLVVAAVGG